MKELHMKAMKHWNNALLALAVVGALGFGAVQAAGGTNPDTGCATKAGCKYGGGRVGCCMLP
jgi:hypothetical protein